MARKFIFKPLFAMVVLSFGAANIAYSENQVEDASKSNLLSLSLADLLNITVSGVTLVETNFLDAPASLNIFDQAALELLNIDSLEQLVPLVPSFHLAYSDDGLYGSISARGRQIGSSGREVLVLVDGMRIENWYAGGSTPTMPNISLLGLEKIEFIRGAISQVYGSGAFTGVINMVSDPEATASKLTLGVNNAYRLQSNLRGSWHQFGHKLFLDIKSEGGENYFVAKPTSGAPVRLSDGGKSIAGHYQAHYGDWSSYAIFSHAAADQYYIGGYYEPSFGESNRDFFNASLRHNKRWNDFYRSDIQVGYRYFQWLVEAELAPVGALSALSIPASEAPLHIVADDNHEYEYWLNWKNYFEVSHRFNVLLGVDWRDIKKSPFAYKSNFDVTGLSRGEFPINSAEDLSIESTFFSRKYEQLISAYLQAILLLNKRNELTVGVRQDEYDISGGKTTPRVALIHKLNKHLALKFIYGEAFRAPGANELYLSDNPVLRGNPDLKPETVKTSEFVAVYEHSDARVQLGYYRSRYEDPIGQVSGSQMRQFKNLESNDSSGIEGNISYQFNANWIGRINFSHIIHKLEDQYRQPDDLAGLIMTYQKEWWTWSYHSLYVSERNSNSATSGTAVKLDPYWVHNCSIRYQFNSPASLSLSLNNIFDKEYRDASLGDNANEVPRRGRDVKMEFTFKF